MILIMQEKKGEDLLQALNKLSETGIDEVGRGALFGPVFAAAVVLNTKNGLTLKELGVIDSKKLTQKKRELLLPQIISLSSDYGIGQSSVSEIDKFGIRFATELSMVRAIKKLRDTPSELIVDGPLPLKSWSGIQRNIVAGDSKFTSVAAASIIAKVYRDILIERLDQKYSGYFLFKNKGYGTKEHFSSIKSNGITHLHRRSFLKKSNLI
tara:strand:+ start:742 stop:1371 length:630 start_codon:yes stop_codon:yes gene_type:complete